MENGNKQQDIIDLREVFKTILSKKILMLKVWIITFIASCIWIFPQPRYYTCTVSLAPETAKEDVGGLASIASNFGFNLGGGGNDAIYPLLYPDLMESKEFITGLFVIKVQTIDQELSTNYYTYLTKHQKKNWLTHPFTKIKRWIINCITDKKTPKPGTGEDIDPFRLSEYDYNLCESIAQNITCSVDKKTDVITISVKDQDALICATMADSVSQHLQSAIIKYRTHKSRLDVEHYQQLAEQALQDYNECVKNYAKYCDSHTGTILQTYVSKRDDMEKEMEIKYSTYTTMRTQLEVCKAKLQERTPAFTILSGSTVPIKPAGPKRVFFVVGMLFFATIVTSVWQVRKIIF